MRKIFKYELDDNMHLPRGAVTLAVAEQRGTACLWALVDPEAPIEPSKIKIYATGEPLPDNPGKFIGTFQLNDGMLVYHVFEGI